MEKLFAEFWEKFEALPVSTKCVVLGVYSIVLIVIF